MNGSTSSPLRDVESSVGPLASLVLAQSITASPEDRERLADELLSCGRAIVLAGAVSGELVPLEGFEVIADDIRSGRFAAIGDALLTIGALPAPR